MLRCPRDISSYCDDILCLALEFLSYDPNFTDNMEEDTDDESHEEEEEEYVFNHIVLYYFFHIYFIFKFNSFFPVKVQMSIQMMRMSAGRFEGLLPSV